MGNNIRLNEKINQFLFERRKSEGGYAEVTNEDMALLNDIVNLLIKAKCQPDPDGDYPIEFMMINRRFERWVIRPRPVNKEIYPLPTYDMLCLTSDAKILLDEIYHQFACKISEENKDKKK